MSPLLFLAIPVVVFAIGSTALCILNRLRDGDALSRQVPSNLRSVANTLGEQRQAGWPVSSHNRPSSRSGSR